MAKISWVCLACGRNEAGRVPPELCPDCGQTECFAEPEGAREARPQIVAASELLPRKIVRRASKDPQLDALLGGGFAFGSWAGLWGPEGSGKSRLALRWSTAIGRVLWCSLEMGENMVRDTATSVGADLRRLYIAEDVEPDDVAELARECEANVVVFDSISELDDAQGLELLLVMRRWVRNRSRFALVICHATKDGKYRGTSKFGHAPDYMLEAAKHSDGCAVSVRKSRFCAQGSAVCPLVKGVTGKPAAKKTRKRSGKNRVA